MRPVLVALTFAWALAAPSRPAPPTMDDFLLFEVVLDRITLSEGIGGYRRDEGAWLALDELVQVLGFAIDVDPRRGRAQGWFVDEERRFFLDAGRRELAVEGRRVDWEPGSVELGPDSLYVDSAAFGRWFPVTLHVDVGQLRVVVEPREKLPLQERRDRRDAWRRIGRDAAGGARDLPRFDVGYGLVDWPSLYAAATLAWADAPSGEGRLDARHEAWISGDLLRLEAELFTSASTSGKSATRFNLGRRRPEPWRLGGLPVTLLEVGDLVTVPDALVKTGRTGRGLAISNHPLDSAVEFDRTVLQGDALPGWEVELFHNEILIDFATVGTEGRYAFTDVPLLTGANLFRLVFHGPRGERREQVRRVLIGDGLLRAGESRYRFSASQQDRGLFGDEPVDETFEAPVDGLGTVDDLESGAARFELAYERGLRGGLSATAALDSLVIAGERHDYSRLGLLASRRGVFARLDAVADSRGGWAARAGARTRLAGIDVVVRGERYFDFRSEQVGRGEDPVFSRSSLRIDGGISTGTRPLRYTFTFESERRPSGAATRTSARLAGSWRRLSLAQSLSFDRATHGDATLRGLLLMSARLRRFALRGRLGYLLDPRAEVERLELTAERSLGGDRRLSFGLRHTLTGLAVTQASAGLSWRFKVFYLGMEVDLSTDGRMAATASFSYGLRREPDSGRWRILARRSSSQGAALARVYLDRNLNERYDGGDEPLEGVRFRTPAAGLSGGTDARGKILLGDLAADHEAGVELVTSSLEDPYRVPVREGVAFVARSGKVPLLEFPVVETGEVDGTVFKEEDGKRAAVSGVRLRLISEDGEVAGETRSEYDGFYLFERVLPGRYVVRLDSEQRARLGLVATSQPRIVIGSDIPVASGVDITLIPMDSDESPTGYRRPTS